MHRRSKRIDTKNHFNREKVVDKTVVVAYTPTDQLAADLPTKAITHVKVEQPRRMLMSSLQILHLDSRKKVRLLR